MDKAELIEKLQNLKGLSERQAKLVKRMIDRLLIGKRDPSLSGEADRKVMNCINAPDPIAEVMGFGANPSSAELDLEMAERILREQREGSSHREIAEAVGCRPEVVGATLKAHGIKSKSGTERMRAAINLEPVVDLVFIYCDAEIQVAVISQARLKQLGIDLGKTLSKKGGATITITEACSDRILLADFGMALRHIETAQLCGNRKVDHEARMIRLSRHSVRAGNDSLILFHTASGRSEVDLPWLKQLFPGVGGLLPEI